ncbi:DNA polymerase III subunit beta, partial [bacterium]|nr:DNA polymerase III subunit beta [bacterium]
SSKALQPVLANVLIETVNNGTIRLVATDLDFTVVALVDAQVEEEGRITLPSKTLTEIVSKLGNKLISFEKTEGESTVNIKCQNSKFDIIGISADEFPPEVYNVNLDEENSFEIDIKTFTKAVEQAGFAAASYESSNLLSGVVCDISGPVLEIASTDGNRLARIRKSIDNKDGRANQLIIPSKALNEFVGVSSYIEEDTVKIYTERTRIIIKSERTLLVSKLLEGQFPKYNQLIPNESPKEAMVSVLALSSAIDRVSIMVNEKTSIVKLSFADNILKLTADSADSGKSEEEVEINYTAEPLDIAFNYKFLLESLKKMNCETVKIGLNTSLSATVLKPESEEDFVCLIMPVQIR